MLCTAVEIHHYFGGGTYCLKMEAVFFSSPVVTRDYTTSHPRIYEQNYICPQYTYMYAWVIGS